MGTSSSFLVCSIAAVNLHGLSLLVLLSILSSLIAFLFAYYLRFIRKLITPPVGGIIILLISITLLPISMNLWLGMPSSEYYETPENFLVGFITIIIILGISFFGKQKLRLWGILIGIISCYIAASYFYLLSFRHFNASPVFGVPNIYFPSFKIVYQPEIIPIFIGFIIATVLAVVETFGDDIAVQEGSER